MTTYAISGPNGLLLMFKNEDDYRRFREDEQRLYFKYYNEIRDKYGVWATNQNRFVPSFENLNNLDNRYMEQLWSSFTNEDNVGK